MKVRPLLVTEPPPEFGELISSPEFHDTSAMNMDMTYVPGFSELRLARDRGMFEASIGKRSPSDVPVLPHNMRWVRVQTKAGIPDNKKMLMTGSIGYKAVTKEEVGEGKLVPSLPPGAHFNAAGEIQQGDVVLTVCSAEAAARSAFRKRAKTEAAVKGVEAGYDVAVNAFGGRSLGASPFITKVVGKRVQAELTPKPAKPESKQGG